MPNKWMVQCWSNKSWNGFSIPKVVALPCTLIPLPLQFLLASRETGEPLIEVFKMCRSELCSNSKDSKDLYADDGDDGRNNENEAVV